MLVPLCDVQDGTRSRNEHPPGESGKSAHARTKAMEGTSRILVAVGNEKVWLQLIEIYLELPDAVRAVDQGHDAFPLTHAHQILKGHPHGRDAHHGLQNRQPRTQTLRLDLGDGSLESGHDILTRRGELEFHLTGLQGPGLGQGSDGVVDGPVGGRQGHDDVPLLKVMVVEDCEDAGGGVGDEDALRD